MAVIGSEIINSGLAADAICDQRLFAAGLQQRWSPDIDLPDTIAELSQDAQDWAGLDELDPRQVERISKLGDKVAMFARLQFGQNTIASFRAHAAINKGRGNCMAYHEVVAGTLAKMGLGAQSYGTWSGAESESDGGHAGSGFVVGDRIVEIDGWFGKSNTRDSVTSPLLYAACKTVTTKPEAVLLGVDRPFDEVDEIAEPIPLDELHTVDIQEGLRPEHYNTIVLPASGAVLMYSAQAALTSSSERFPEAWGVLQDYAPSL